ncbi:MAG: phosphoadenosine phosphosulfate sulfurtransferase [Flavobacteriales bacterium]|nr:MAG: phosphoadenosine phosphosulfate sulfurtransferase [Flavobacteriales bacterium]
MNVYQATQQRLEFIFKEFDNVYVSFSGGKDSGVMLEICMDYVRKNNLKKLRVFHLNYEAEYSFTRNYVDAIFEKNKDILEVYNICVPFKVETCTSMTQTYWRPWEDDKKDIWINEMPKNALVKSDFDFYNENMWDYEFQEKFSRWLHNKVKAEKTCVLVGIRTQESLNRWRAIHSDRNNRNYQGKKWTKKVFDNIYNAYPIYDWITDDVWIANSKFGWEYNQLYDMFFKAGVAVEQMRVASPFLSTAKSSLKLFRVIEPDTWSKLVSRVNGVNFTGIYGGTTAMGWGSISKPEHFTWKEYMFFLLDTLPEETKQNYLNKLGTSIKFWQEKGGVLSEDIIQQLKQRNIKIEVGIKTNYKTEKKPVKMEYQDDIDIKEFKLIPTYKRMCVCIMKNDHLCKYMGFSFTKRETERRKKIMNKYKSLL